MGVIQSILGEEHENYNTPPRTRFLPKKFDPRSPSEDITRTPIEVAVTPKIKDVKSTSLSFNTSKISKCVSDDAKEANLLNIEENNCEKEISNEGELIDSLQHDISNNCEVKSSGVPDSNMTTQNTDEKDSVVNFERNNEVKRMDKNLECNDMDSGNNVSVTPYLETDIDAIDNSLCNSLHIEHPRVRQLRKYKNKSLSLPNEFNSSTSVMDITSSDSLIAKIDSMSFTDVSIDDLSVLVSDIENEDVSVLKKDPPVSAIKEWLITIEDGCESIAPFHIPEDNENNVEQRQCLTTPGRKNKSLKERTPLSCLAANSMCTPPKESAKTKQWRGIQEERERRGLALVDENTPPMQYVQPDTVSSAPGKLMRQPRKINWDKDNTMVI